MLEDLRRAFGLRDEDEVVAIFVTFLVAILGLLFFLRGCGPAEIIAETGEIAAITDTDARPVADLPEFRVADADGEVEFVGSYLPNSEVEIVVDGESVGQTTTDASGNWRFSHQLDERGDHSLRVVGLAAGAAGLAAANSIDYDFEWRDGVAVATKRAPATIAPRPTDAPAIAAAPVQVATDVPTVEPTLEPTATMAATATTEPTAEPTPTLAPTATPEPTAEPTAEPEPTATAEPTVEPTAVPEPTAEVVSAEFIATFGDLAISPLASSEQSRVVTTVEGSGPAGATVRILLGNSTLADVIIGEDGTWSYDADLTLDPEQYSMSAALLDDAGNTIEEDSASIEFVIDAANEGASGLVEVVFAVAEDAEAADGDNLVTLSGGVPAVELILDASWSMRIAIDDFDNSRISVAKEALTDVVTNVLPEGMPVAFRAFGNVEGNYACRTDLMLPLAPLDRDTLLGEIRRTTPIWNANTPIAASLAAVSSDLADASGPITLVLLTDGEETCDGDPAAEITKLRESGIDVRVNIVGLQLEDDALKDEFARWAELGGGTYIDVSADSAELADALQRSMQVGYTIVDESDTIVARGTVGGSPLRVVAGDYTLRIGSSESPITVTADSTTTIQPAP